MPTLDGQGNRQPGPWLEWGQGSSLPKPPLQAPREVGAATGWGLGRQAFSRATISCGQRGRQGLERELGVVAGQLG